MPDSFSRLSDSPFVWTYHLLFVLTGVYPFIWLICAFFSLSHSSSCCFFPRSGRRSSPSPPPEEEKDHFEVWAPVVDSEAPSLESPPLPPPTSPSCCDFARPDEGPSGPQPVRRSLGGDHAVPLDPSQSGTVLEK